MTLQEISIGMSETKVGIIAPRLVAFTNIKDEFG
jgi:hypothetical protein